MRRARSILITATIVVALLLGAILVYWVTSTRGPTQLALASLNSNAEVTITQGSGLITFKPVQKRASTGVVFYPGAGVDFRSYAPPLRELAARGFFVATPHMPLNIAFLNPNAAEAVILHYPDIHTWVVAGHSLGGVAAASYAAEHADLAGLVLWASYPANDSLRRSDIPILSIYGSADGLTTLEDIRASRSSLPEGAWFVKIPGGNHAQFGSYGPQGGDNPATISAEAQWAIIVEAMTLFMEQASD